MEILVSIATLFLRFLALFLGDQPDDGNVILITGGLDGKALEALSSVEVFDPSNPSLNCTLPSLSVERFHHAASGLTVCGHFWDEQSCETLDEHQWTVSHQLEQKRKSHVMWQSPNKGVLLMGGEYGENTVETLQDDGNSVMQQWKLKDRTE